MGAFSFSKGSKGRGTQVEVIQKLEQALVLWRPLQSPCPSWKQVHSNKLNPKICAHFELTRAINLWLKPMNDFKLAIYSSCTDCHAGDERAEREAASRPHREQMQDHPGLKETWEVFDGRVFTITRRTKSNVLNTHTLHCYCLGP